MKLQTPLFKLLNSTRIEYGECGSIRTLTGNCPMCDKILLACVWLFKFLLTLILIPQKRDMANGPYCRCYILVADRNGWL